MASTHGGSLVKGVVTTHVVICSQRRSLAVITGSFASRWRKSTIWMRYCCVDVRAGVKLSHHTTSCSSGFSSHLRRASPPALTSRHAVQVNITNRSRSSVLCTQAAADDTTAVFRKVSGSATVETTSWPLTHKPFHLQTNISSRKMEELVLRLHEIEASHFTLPGVLLQ